MDLVTSISNELFWVDLRLLKGVVEFSFSRVARFDMSEPPISMPLSSVSEASPPFVNMELFFEIPKIGASLTRRLLSADRT